jgi:hypothetical protein
MPSEVRSGKYLHLHPYRRRRVTPTHFSASLLLVSFQVAGATRKLPYPRSWDLIEADLGAGLELTASTRRTPTASPRTSHPHTQHSRR